MVESKDKGLLSIARDRYAKAAEYWSEERKAAIDDIKFRAGEQWPTQIKSQRESDKRPCLTVDKLNQYIRQIVNDGRQNRPAIKVRPVDSGADVATAEVFAGIVKHIEDASNADAAYDTALDNAATCGFGYFRVLTEYVGDDSFDQDIRIKRIRNPLSVVIDPMTQEADCSDMKFAFIIDEMSKDDFKAQYPDKVPEDWKCEKDDANEWYENTVRVAEYWWVEETNEKLHKTKEGFVISETDLIEFRKQGYNATIIETRTIPKHKVKWCKMTGDDYIDEPRDWPGKWIPILVVYGNELDVEGKAVHTGIIRPAKDAQRLYNYSRSAFAERVALSPKSPWVAAEGQVEDYEDEWATANTENHQVLRYKPVSIGGNPVPMPQRQTAQDVPVGFAQDMQISEHDIQSAIGMYNASLGAPSNERSGKAIQARQREGDVGTFHYHDNLNRAIRHCGRILIDLIPKIYDTSRVVRILGYDGTPSEAQIDAGIPTASQQVGVQMVYNLGVGNYDVSISSGPSYTTLRQEAATAMIEMVQANPNLMAVAGDLIVKQQDWPGAEELSERLKLTLPPEIQQAEAQKKQKGMPPEMQQIVSQFEQALQQKDQLIDQASSRIEELMRENEDLKSETEVKEKEVVIKAVDSEIKAYQAETQRLQALQQAMTPEQIQQIVLQTLTDLMQPNSVQYPQPEAAQEEIVEPANMPPQGMESPMEQPNV